MIWNEFKSFKKISVFPACIPNKIDHRSLYFIALNTYPPENIYFKFFAGVIGFVL